MIQRRRGSVARHGTELDWQKWKRNPALNTTAPDVWLQAFEQINNSQSAHTSSNIIMFEQFPGPAHVPKIRMPWFQHFVWEGRLENWWGL